MLVGKLISNLLVVLLQVVFLFAAGMFVLPAAWRVSSMTRLSGRRVMLSFRPST